MYRVYYDDGSFSENEVTQPYRVICIAQPREKTGREVLRAHPYYILKHGHWRPAEDLASLVQQVIYYAKDIDAVVMGIWTDQENYRKIVSAALADDGLPPRSAEDPDRRR
jgi:hypothetical protein